MPQVLKVLLLADIYSEHTEKWALGLASQGLKVGIFSFNKASYPWYEGRENISLLYEPKQRLGASSDSGKLAYLKHVGLLKKALKEFKPDVLHAHYATSYGLIGALSGFHPLVISAWGTDVMKFPQKNFLNRAMLNYNLRKADVICATSFTIKDYLKPVTDKPVTVIPFGVDTGKFKKKTVSSVAGAGSFVFGSIKPLEALYNTDVLMRAFAVLKRKHPDKKMTLLIIGEGSQAQKLKELVEELNITREVIFTGRVPFSQIADYYNMLDVLINISDYESFGVSVIEAMACEKPVIVTNTGGLKEIVENANFGSLVEVGNVEQTATEMEKYLLDKELTERVGKKGREKVILKYKWEDNIKQMISVYQQLRKQT
jgi:glycosyltransferase involved in cell wall biosynthesis